MGLRQVKAVLVSYWGGDRDAANAAWASSTDVDKLNTRSDEDVRRVVSNIVTLGHDTPKERVWLDFFATCPIFVERQFDKYRMTTQVQDMVIDCNVAEFGRHGITQNELSGRYRTIPDRPYEMPNDVTSIISKSFNEHCANNAKQMFLDMQEDAFSKYTTLINNVKNCRDRGEITSDEYKRARDVLRGLLPVATLTDMRLVMNMNAFEWIMNQRLPNSAQLESRVLAYQMLNSVVQQNVSPVMVAKMIDTNGWQKYIDEVEKLISEDN